MEWYGAGLLKWETSTMNHGLRLRVRLKNVFLHIIQINRPGRINPLHADYYFPPNLFLNSTGSHLSFQDGSQHCSAHLTPSSVWLFPLPFWYSSSVFLAVLSDALWLCLPRLHRHHPPRVCEAVVFWIEAVFNHFLKNRIDLANTASNVLLYSNFIFNSEVFLQHNALLEEAAKENQERPAQTVFHQIKPSPCVVHYTEKHNLWRGLHF